VGFRQELFLVRDDLRERVRNGYSSMLPRETGRDELVEQRNYLSEAGGISGGGLAGVCMPVVA
jgi:hypothetical protein